jgi:hypothetical protein
MCAAAHGWVYDWQTLIAGIFALAAGTGTVFATIWSANREIAAAKTQTATMREIESLRVAREGYAFYVMLKAALETVIADVAAARTMPPPNPRGHGEVYSTNAYAVRQRVKRTGFAELRPAFLRFGGATTGKKFLQLDQEIEDFTVQWMPAYNSATGQLGQPLGANAGIKDHLNRIDQQARDLLHDADREMTITLGNLGNDLA